MERPSAACARSVGVFDRRRASLHLAVGLGHARPLGGAELEQGRPCRAAGASSSSARRRNRTACSGEPRSAAAARGRQHVERPALGDGADGEQVGGRALAARRVARQLAGGGDVELRPLGRRDRVRSALLDDRVDEPRRRSR